MFCMLGSHLDIVHTICVVAKFLQHLQQIHYIVINMHIFKYLHGIIWLLIIMEVNIAQTLEEKLLFAIVCLFVCLLQMTFFSCEWDFFHYKNGLKMIHSFSYVIFWQLIQIVNCLKTLMTRKSEVVELFSSTQVLIGGFHNNIQFYTIGFNVLK
jgi:hypothetical protein